MNTLDVKTASFGVWIMAMALAAGTVLGHLFFFLMAGCGGRSGTAGPTEITIPEPIDGSALQDALDPCAVNVPIECPPDSHVIMGPLCLDVGHGTQVDMVPIPTACLCNVTCACVSATVCGDGGVLECDDNPLQILCN